MRKLRIQGRLGDPRNFPEEGEIWCCDENVWDASAYGKKDSEKPNEDHPGWVLVRQFWPSVWLLTEWPEVSVPAVPPARWWRLVLYNREGAPMYLNDLQIEGFAIPPSSSLK